jgi:hypothetical protein
LSACYSGSSEQPSFVLYDRRDSIRELDGVHPDIPNDSGAYFEQFTKDNNVYRGWDDRTISVAIPDGRKFSHFSHLTVVALFNGKLSFVQLCVFKEPESLASTIDAVEHLIEEWKLHPSGYIPTLLKEMRDAMKTQNTPPPLPPPQPGITVTSINPKLGNWGGDHGRMALSPDADLELDIRPQIGSQDRYSICVTITAPTKWLAAEPISVPTTQGVSKP